MPKQINVDVKQFEELIASGASVGKAAAVLGIKEGTLFYKCSAEPDLKAAYERGRARAKGQTAAAPKITLDATDEGVLDTIEDMGEAGARWSEIKGATGFNDEQIGVSIKKLTDSGRIVKRKLGAGQIITYFAAKDSDHVPASPVKKTVVEPPAEAHEAVVVSDARTSQTIDKLPRTQAQTRALVKRDTPSASQATIAEVMPPPARLMPETPSEAVEVNPSQTRIMEAARVELLWMRLYGEASPKGADVVELLNRQLSA